MEDETQQLRARIAVLEAELEQQREAHAAEMKRLNYENYESLESSKTRYHGELDIQHANFGLHIAEMK